MTLLVQKVYVKGITRNQKANTDTSRQSSGCLSAYLSTVRRYEQSIPSLKYEAITNRLTSYNEITETTGILTLDDIQSAVKQVLENYDVKYCYLFGSYAKGKANESSDVDLFIDGENVTGLNFYGLIEELRETLHKKIDLLNINDFNSNHSIQNEILKDGIKIYG